MWVSDTSEVWVWTRSAVQAGRPWLDLGTDKCYHMQRKILKNNDYNRRMQDDEYDCVRFRQCAYSWPAAQLRKRPVSRCSRACRHANDRSVRLRSDVRPCYPARHELHPFHVRFASTPRTWRRTDRVVPDSLISVGGRSAGWAASTAPGLHRDRAFPAPPSRSEMRAPDLAFGAATPIEDPQPDGLRKIHAPRLIVCGVQICRIVPGSDLARLGSGLEAISEDPFHLHCPDIAGRTLWSAEAALIQCVDRRRISAGAGVAGVNRRAAGAK